jgi:hypothetical protein
VFDCAKTLVACAFLGLSGCLTPEMGREVDDALGLTPRVDATWVNDTQLATAFDGDRALPARIWYADAVARIYHERRTNTYVAYDPVHTGWAAVPADVAVARGFRPERARLLPQGVPDDVQKVIDYLTSMEPGWRGS